MKSIQQRNLEIFEALEKGAGSEDIAEKHDMSVSTVERIWREGRAAARARGRTVRHRPKQKKGKTHNFNWAYDGFLSPHLFLLYKLFLERASPWAAERRLRLSGAKFMLPGGRRYRHSYVSRSIAFLFFHDGPRVSPEQAKALIVARRIEHTAEADRIAAAEDQIDKVIEFCTRGHGSMRTPEERERAARQREIANAEIDDLEIWEVVTRNGLSYIRIDPRRDSVLSAGAPLTSLRDRTRAQCALHCKRKGHKAAKIFPAEKDDL